MTDDQRESPLRSMIAGSNGEDHVFHRSLESAQSDANGVVIFEGDDGGQIYATVRAAFVRCDEAQLARLLAELDSLHWSAPDMASISYESAPVGTLIAGGMGGGMVTSEVWVHPELPVSIAAVRAVVLGEAVSVLQ